MITVHVEPRVVISWKEFCETKPKYSVALDGYVSEKTMRDPDNIMANFDHHTNVDRVSTRSTAEQVYLEINLGLFDAFRKDGIPQMDIFVNDCDEDTILSIWLLQNHEQVTDNATPLINKLVFCNDKLDSTGGLYPFGDTSQLRKMAWMFEPYRAARRSQKLSSLNVQEMTDIIESCLARISKYMNHHGEESSMQITFSLLGGGKEWSLVKESSTSARMLIFSSGINSIISVIQEGRYVIAKKSMWIKFPIEDLYIHLNKLEGRNVWGGSNTIGGSLREIPSKFSSKELEKIVNDFLEKK